MVLSNRDTQQVEPDLESAACPAFMSTRDLPVGLRFGLADNVEAKARSAEKTADAPA